MKTWFVAGIFALTPLWAQAGGYAALDYVFSDIEPDAYDADASVSSLQFRFGAYLTPERTFGYEIRAALGMNDDEIGSNGPEVEIDRYYGAYLRAQFPDNIPVRPYGMLGVTRMETTESPGGSENYNDLSLGFGAELSLDRNLFLSLEYLRVVDRSGDEVSNLGIGIGGRF